MNLLHVLLVLCTMVGLTPVVAHTAPVRVQRRYTGWIVLVLGLIAWHMGNSFLVPAGLVWPVSHVHHWFGFEPAEDPANFGPAVTAAKRLAARIWGLAATAYHRLPWTPIPPEPEPVEVTNFAEHAYPDPDEPEDIEDVEELEPPAQQTQVRKFVPPL